MRKFGWLAAAVVFCAPVISRADFIISHVRTEGTGSLTGFHIYKFYAKNTQSGMHPTSTTLAGVDFVIQSLGQPFKFKIQDLDGDERLDVNAVGSGMNDITPTGTFVKVGNGSPILAMALPQSVPFQSTATFDSVAYYTNRTDFHIVTAPDRDSRPDATTGIGARFAVVIVPLGSDVRLSGQVADEMGISGASDNGENASDSGAMNLPDTGSDTTYTPTPGYFQVPEYIAQAPEPGSLALLGMAGVAFFRRSRR